MITTRQRLAGLMLGTSLVAAACTGGTSPDASVGGATSGPNVTLQGAGATFPNPLYQVWFERYTEAHPNILFNYQSIGSGGGIKAITERTVDFGASDAPMKDDELAKLPAGTTLLHVPTALGAVVVTYNLPGVAALRLDGDTIAGIFLGSIANWHDPKIAAINEGLSLPDQAILVVHRSDGSGTTNAFTTYLDTVSPDWHGSVGAGKEVQWPTGQGAQGNDGVAAGVRNTPGAVGYVELQYAAQAGLTSALVKNADGQFVAGSTEGVTAAAEAAVAAFPADLRQAPIINGAGPATYPIASYTYLLVYVDQEDADKGRALVAFVEWALTDGQAVERELGFAPLPGPIREKALAALDSITTGGAPIRP